MKLNAVLAVFAVHCFNIGLVRTQSPQVCLNGTSCVIGKYMEGFQKRLFEGFLGIPFAKPPIGDLRFSNPVEYGLWEGTLAARNPKPDCIQKDYVKAGSSIQGSEDCLYLNVYRPLNVGYKKLPVLFYLYAGGFSSGSASPQAQGPEYFMDTDEVILVIPAYRLGPFGFLSTNDEEMPGNFGLKDQNLALKWIQKYISAFSGDPDRVTIFGNSAGAAAAHYQLLSPASKDLYRNAILASGAAILPFARPLTDPKSRAIELAEAVGIREAAYLTSEGLVRALRKINPSVLIKAVDKLKSWYIHPLGIFHPVIEQSSWNGAFLTADPSSLSIEKPWIIGHVTSKGEGGPLANRLITSTSLRAQFNDNFDKLLGVMLEFPDTIDRAALNRTIEMYMNGQHKLNDETLDGFCELVGDGGFVYPIYKTIQFNVNSAVAQNLKGIIRFDYRGPYSFSQTYTGSNANYSTAHGDDSLFLFRVPAEFPRNYPLISPEATLVKRYVGLYVEFAKTGKVSELEDIGACTRASFEKGSCKYLSIVKSPALFQTGSTWNINKMKSWDDVYKVGASP
ncbi:PREDICTED: venom carboxylesterase-6-like [Rhagoletis zephyria]|uniref:venom carboxylesterase-6-like n=1 Tax=Rhagoletis zephyria TaxID=28612 RepID=UPI0008113881|nr:PREDICTED: venom carboxylesterase-6-like [Rhagoletis zephyria]